MKIIVITLDNLILSVQSAEDVTKITRRNASVYMGELSSIREELITDGVEDLSMLDNYEQDELRRMENEEMGNIN